jgi:hypothetical protein
LIAGFSGVHDTDVTDRVKIGLAAAIIVAALGIWFWSGRAERQLVAENAQALEGVAYQLQCSACNHVFEAPAGTYFAEVGDEGLKCIHCGEPKAWRVGVVGAEPEEFKAEAAKISSIEELRERSNELEGKIAELEAQFLSPEIASDPARSEDIGNQLKRLRARHHALGLRWDELIEASRT